ncbi:MAG: hypothetical protein A2297_07280 [Elusimicrobia bacterium RIFOXYB2_FULL_48_7]|nr:MAG: hypothetical protein A2297_07280 [Elusimicrobia bacterium RIFOXYB2_FULL_48_7]
MKYPKLRELKEAIKAIVKGPYTTRFPYEPHTPEIRFRGRPVPSEKGCIGCGACAEVCPANAIEIINEPPVRKVIWHYDLCIFCAQCERLCTTQEGVKLSNTEFDLATTDRKSLHDGVEKELLVCEKCGEIIAPVDQLLWAAKKIGPMAYGNYVLFSTLQQTLEVSQKNTPNPDIEGTSRADLFKLTCPKCRHLVHLFDEYGIK